MVRWTLVVTFLCAIIAAVAGLNPFSSTPPVPQRPTVAAGLGSIQGIVRFDGVAPPPRIISGDNECCPGAAPAIDESTVVNGNGTLKNVVVYIKDGPNVPTDMPPVVLDQKDCTYRPHVLALQTGQPLDVTNHDPTTHNVYFQASVNASQNFSENTVGQVHRVFFPLPEFINVKCAVHPWMSAFVCVFDHPFFAVTGSDGTFHIDRLPAGSYTLTAWHEKYGPLDRSITIAGAQPASVEFEYKGPT